MKVKLTKPTAKIPYRANPTDAGADLFATETVIIENNYQMDLGVQIELPKGTVGLIFARSSLGGQGITPRNCVGVIDEKYRGNLGIRIKNDNPCPAKIMEGDRIAQLVIVPVLTPEFELVEELDMEGDRNGGFGSTGK